MAQVRETICTCVCFDKQGAERGHMIVQDGCVYAQHQARSLVDALNAAIFAGSYQILRSWLLLIEGLSEDDVGGVDVIEGFW